MNLETFELKQLGAGEVLVKILACGVFRSDVGMQKGEFGPVNPRIPGHELGQFQSCENGAINGVPNLFSSVRKPLSRFLGP